MTFEQWLFNKKDQLALLEQWRTCAQFGMTTKAFCQKLVDNGSPSSKKIGQAGLDAPGLGLRFTDVLQGWLSPVAVSTLVIAEKNGQLTQGIDIAIQELKGGQGVMGELLKITFFPMFTFIGVGLLGVYVSGEIIVTANLQGSMAELWRAAVVGPGTMILAIFIAILVAAGVSMPLWTGASRQWVEDLWLFSHYRIAAAGNLLGTLANLSSAGMNLSQAIEETLPHSTRYLKSHLTEMKKRLSTQSNPGKALDTGLLLKDAQINLDMMGDIAPLTKLLEQSSQQHHAHIERSLSRMQMFLPNIILVLAILLLASLVGTAIASLLSTLKF